MGRKVVAKHYEGGSGIGAEIWERLHYSGNRNTQRVRDRNQNP